MTDLIISTSFKSALIPSYLTVPDSHLNKRAWEDRNLHEIDFSDTKGARIGSFEAYNFYRDRSFYLLNSPRHAVRHVSSSSYDC